MRTAIAAHELLPEGLYLESLSVERGRVGIRVASRANRPRCPICGIVSSRAHSRYLRTVSDLPWHGISVEVRARRLFCDEPSCESSIFCERLPDIANRARKTRRLEGTLLAIVLELGGRAGARPAAELGHVVGRDGLPSPPEQSEERSASGRRNSEGARRGRFRLQEGATSTARCSCIRSKRRWKRRSITVRADGHQQALEADRIRREKVPGFATAYAKRAGIEGTVSQAVRTCGVRRSRYVGLEKTQLHHPLSAAALNFLRVGEWLSGIEKHKTRCAPFARLMAQQAAA